MPSLRLQPSSRFRMSLPAAGFLPFAGRGRAAAGTAAVSTGAVSTAAVSTGAFSTVAASSGAVAACLRAFVSAWLLALAMLVMATPARAEGFDRQTSTQRYRQWLDDFERDFRRLRSVPQATNADVERIFTDTLVPGSRAVVLVRKLNELRQNDLSNLSGGLLIALMRGAVVAGDGGTYTDTPPDLEPKVLRVWYLHVAGGEQLERYFADPEAFKPYRLPDNGTFERDVYPFLLFEDGPRLRLGAVPREFWNMLRFLENLPYA